MSVSVPHVVFTVSLKSNMHRAISTHVNAFRGVMWAGASAANPSLTKDDYTSALYQCVQDKLKDYIVISASPFKLKKFAASIVSTQA
jgi:hypothetical protein